MNLETRRLTHPGKVPLSILSVIGSVLLGGAFVSHAETNSLNVRAIAVNGEVTINAKPLVPGASVKIGDRIVTQNSGSVKLLYPDHSIVDVNPASKFVVSELNSSGGMTSELEFGMIRALVKKKLEANKTFTIKTKTSVLAVRGTEFGVSVEPMAGGAFKESVTVGAGRVDVQPMAGGAPFQVLSGQRFEQAAPATGSRSPSSEPATQGRVVNIAPKEIQKALDQVTVPDRTFEQQIDVGKPTSENGGPRAGGATLALLSTEVKAPPVFKPADVSKAMEGGKVAIPPRPPEPSPLAQLNPEISDQLPVRVSVKFVIP